MTKDKPKNKGKNNIHNKKGDSFFGNGSQKNLNSKGFNSNKINRSFKSN